VEFVGQGCHQPFENLDRLLTAVNEKNQFMEGIMGLIYTKL
jgi:hypothetical protein